MENIRIVIAGAGAAGVAIVRILLGAGANEILVCDSKGIIHQNRSDISEGIKQWLAKETNSKNEEGHLSNAMENADLLIGVSGPGIISRKDVQLMASDSMVFALANPVPEIQPEEINDIARIIATGRSDYPNQINNVLAFPGLFRGALDARAHDINESMKLAAAHAIANCIDENDLGSEYIVPSVFNKKVVRTVARAVKKAAYDSGVAVRKKAPFN